MSIKSEKFVILAEKRVNNAIKQLELVGNLSNKSSYEYTEQQAKKIIGVLKETLKSTEQKFNDEINGKKKFKL